MSSEIWKQQTKQVVEHWFRCQNLNCNISISNIVSIILLFYHPIDILRWSNEYVTANSFTFTDDMKCIQKKHNHIFDFWSNCHILPDTEPVFNGCHCWRINVKNANKELIFYGISEKSKLDISKPLATFKAYGISIQSNSWFGNEYEYYPRNMLFTARFGYNFVRHWIITDGTSFPGENVIKLIVEYAYIQHVKNNKDDTNLKCFQQTNVDIDILLNADIGQLNICVVGQCEKGKEVIILNLPTRMLGNGWVPHLVIKERSSLLRIAMMPVSLYGVMQDNVFHSNNHMAKTNVSLI
eukprot:201335_1